jgi:hypothetical protein
VLTAKPVGLAVSWGDSDHILGPKLVVDLTGAMEVPELDPGRATHRALPARQRLPPILRVQDGSRVTDDETTTTDEKVAA